MWYLFLFCYFITYLIQNPLSVDPILLQKVGIFCEVMTFSVQNLRRAIWHWQTGCHGAFFWGKQMICLIWLLWPFLVFSTIYVLVYICMHKMRLYLLYLRRWVTKNSPYVSDWVLTSTVPSVSPLHI